jgi:hypothetical protein
MMATTAAAAGPFIENVGIEDWTTVSDVVSDAAIARACFSLDETATFCHDILPGPVPCSALGCVVRADIPDDFQLPGRFVHFTLQDVNGVTSNEILLLIPEPNGGD